MIMKDKNTLGYKILSVILKPFFLLFYRVKIVNKEVIPKKGPVIFCGNHLDVKDQLPVIASTNRMIHWMSKKEYFDGKFSWFFKLVGCISVDRENHGGDSLDIALDYLKRGSAIGIFPEGTRNKTDAELLPFKIGAVYLAQKSEATIVPFAVTGDFKFRSKNTMVRFGEPFKIDIDDNLDDMNTLLRDKILELQRINYKETKYKRSQFNDN